MSPGLGKSRDGGGTSPRGNLTSPGRPAISVQVDDVNIGRVGRDALLQNFETLIHQREGDPVDDFISAQFCTPLWRMHRIFVYQLLHFGRRQRFATLADFWVVIVPSLCSGISIM